MTEQERYEIMYDEIVELKRIIKSQDAEIEMLRAMLITQTEYAQDLEKALREAKGGE